MKKDEPKMDNYYVPPNRGKWTRTAIANDMRLYAVTDRAWLNGRSLADCVKDAILGGATFVQLREKDASPEETLELAHSLKSICQTYNTPFVIDDDVALAKKVGADGVHVGQSDVACAEARRVLGEDAIVGVSAQTVEQALAAQAAGADYLGVGAVVSTSTKPEAAALSTDQIQAICEAVDIPVVAIGGINKDTIHLLKDTDVDGVAVVSAIFAADDIQKATEELSEAVAEYIL